MKKLFVFSLALVLAFSLIGCASTTEETTSNNNSELNDGSYLVKNDVSDHGNFAMAYMEVKNGEIVAFDYQEYLAESGESKVNADSYNYDATKQIIPSLNDQFMEKKSLDKLDFDVVSGATSTKNHFKQATKDLLAKAKNGETYTPKYEDGVYTAKADEASHGWLAEIKIVIEHGSIVGVDYDEIKDGEEKTADNYDYAESPQAMADFEKQMINKNGIDELAYDVTSGATNTKNAIVGLAKKALE